MSPKAMQSWRPLQEQEALRFIQRLLHTPQDLVAHIRQTAGATVVKLTYGYTIHDASDRFIITAEQAMDSFSALTTPGAFMVDVFPWMQYIPWASFKKVAVEAGKQLTRLENMPMGFKTGGGDHSLVSKWLESPTKEQDYGEMVKSAAASLYAGGADTTVSAISTFFIAMLYNPTAQATAQAEIEHVVGTDRLPTYADRESLPYVEAVYKEVLRWQPLAPLGLPHQYTAEKDDEYKGMRIPANSTVIANVWAILRDPSTYENPDKFNPDRHLGIDAEPNPEDVAFGFGRRPSFGEDGKKILPSLNYSNATVSHPPPFPCEIAPRSDKIKKLIEETLL
ncbi:hypothetical protein FRC07_006966 [Ceratobasidium sp. 392]|nr:hypothetical protein FRC07_006966 [Ceratobasidium sp. 392]